MASGLSVPHQQAEHMAAPTSNAEHQITLAKGEPSTHGYSRLFRMSHSMSQKAGKLPSLAWRLTAEVGQEATC
jgi:hypothetical protein